MFPSIECNCRQNVCRGKIRYRWYKSLLINYLSRLAAYPAYQALTDTEMSIKINDDRIVFNKPIVETIPVHDPRFNAVEKICKDNAYRVANYDRIYRKKKNLDQERKNKGKEYIPEPYMPDVLGFYLPEDRMVFGVRLDHGIYINVHRIKEYWQYSLKMIGGINLNAIIGTVFYHEYYHMMFDYIVDKEAFVKYHIEYDDIFDSYALEESLAELFAFMTTRQLDNLLYGPCTSLYNCEYKEDRRFPEKVNSNVYAKIYTQMLCPKLFLKLPRPYPYCLVYNYVLSIAYKPFPRYQCCTHNYCIFGDTISRTLYYILRHNDIVSLKAKNVTPHVYLVGLDSDLDDVEIDCEDLC